MAVANYHSHMGHYPPAYIADENGTPMHSWRVLLLPYIEEQRLFNKYDFSQPWNSKANLQLAKEMPSIFAFHGEYGRGATFTTNYLAVIGDNTMWPGGSHRSTDEITDQSSSTILIVENAGENVHWMEPRDLHIDTMSLAVNDPKGVSSKYLSPAVVLLDNTLRKLEHPLPSDVFRALVTVNGNEPLALSGSGWELLPDGRLRDEQESDVRGTE